jgi:hypothetical protein
MTKAAGILCHSLRDFDSAIAEPDLGKFDHGKMLLIR